jgi:hypothetical protein
MALLIVFIRLLFVLNFAKPVSFKVANYFIYIKVSVIDFLKCKSIDLFLKRINLHEAVITVRKVKISTYPAFIHPSSIWKLQLINLGATVTVCNSKTQNIEFYTKIINGYFSQILKINNIEIH